MNSRTDLASAYSETDRYETSMNELCELFYCLVKESKHILECLQEGSTAVPRIIV
ncbi:AAEL000555-PA [Aedes aegypti]|uniref:AAEL000555-PA n=1 Tax=Aedes aegypti TaxID=7159 RepID=Q16XX6_AEDAE|nr:AAEL008731-PA [Aedes aegypti]EAT48415.1 AAEL000555-PA [Aedes aegypti]